MGPPFMLPLAQPEHQGGAVVRRARLLIAFIDELLGQLPGALAVKGGQLVPHPLVGLSAGDSVADEQYAVSRFQLQMGHVGGAALASRQPGGEGAAGDPADGGPFFDIAGSRAYL